MKKHKRILAVILLVLLTITIPMSAFAHSGRTDSSGGHHDYKNKSGLGYYHYHCGGNPPHLHKNGVCPYSGSSTSTSTSSQSSNSTTSNQSTNLIDKYKNVIDDYDNKNKSGYFRKDVDTIMMQALHADPNSADALILSLMTPEEIADLLPINTEAKRYVMSKLYYARVYEVFLGQIVAQEQQVAAAKQAQDNANIVKLVSQTQAILNSLGLYTGEIDGIYDVETQQAVINFQTIYGLTVDGNINEQVISVLGIQL